MSLHNGSCSSVFESENKKFAYKFNRKRKLIGSSFLNEIQIMKYMEHPNNMYTTELESVILSNTYLDDPDYDGLALKMKKYDSNLFEFISNDPCGLLTNEVKFDICLSVCLSVYYMHTMDIVHTDIKPGNVIMDTVNPILCDFDTSFFNRTNTKLRKTFKPRTLNYGAPELFSGKEYSFPIDIWALGLVICFIFGKTFNVENLNDSLRISCFSPTEESNVKNFYNLEKIESNIVKFDSFEDERENDLLGDLVRKCLHPIPSKRITISDILNHSFLKRERTKPVILKHKEKINQIAYEKLKRYSYFSPSENFITFGVRKPVIEHLREISKNISTENKFEIVSQTIRLFDLYLSREKTINVESLKTLIFFIFNMVIKTLYKNEITDEYLKTFKIVGEDQFIKKELEIFKNLDYIITSPYITDVKSVKSTEECIVDFFEKNKIILYRNLGDLETKFQNLNLKC